jgi:hypothetical protein
MTILPYLQVVKGEDITPETSVYDRISCTANPVCIPCCIDFSFLIETILNVSQPLVAVTK